MRDGSLRRVVKWVARWLAAAELGLRRRLGGRPPYRLSGSCNGCGRCCESPALQVGHLTSGVPALRALVVWWQRVVNGFELTGDDPRLRVLVFRCTHYEVATKQCDSYDSRPLSCRDYPVNQTHEAVPQLFDECGYRAVDRNAEGLRRSLEQAGVPPDTLAELEEKLFLGKREDRDG